MKIAVFVHFYLPYRCAGSETMLHAMVKKLVDKGHEVRVVATVLPESPYPYYEYQGVNVWVTNVVYGKQMIESWRPDVIVSHHDNTDRAARISAKTNIPFVFIMHNDFDFTIGKLGYHPDLTVFNTDVFADRYGHLVDNHMTLHPPVWAEQHRTTPGECVTLVNLNADKGANIFYELASRMPDVQFLGVVGGHGPQIVRYDLPNVTIQPQTDNMKDDVWARTKILLMPSKYESYGMAGVEALASGIPVICTPTPGLLESQGPNGIFVDRDDIGRYEYYIRELMRDWKVWAHYATNAQQRSYQLDPTPELDLWVTKIEELATRPRREPNTFRSIGVS